MSTDKYILPATRRRRDDKQQPRIECARDAVLLRDEQLQRLAAKRLPPTMHGLIRAEQELRQLFPSLRTGAAL